MELPNRPQLEEQIADRLADLSTRQRHELEDLLGTPPRYSNVPQEFWDRVRRENEEELAAILLLLFAMSADYHATLAGDETPRTRQVLAATADRWATQRAREVTKDYIDSAQRYVAEKLPDEPTRPAAPEETPESPEPIRPDQQTPGQELPPETQPVAPGEPGTSVEDWLQRVMINTFGPANDARRALDEVTAAQTAGGEEAVRRTVGLSIRDRWRTNPGRLPGSLKLSRTGPCPICKPMDGVRRLGWIDPRGPGPWIHNGCVCDVLYANIPEGVTPPWGRPYTLQIELPEPEIPSVSQTPFFY